MVSSAAPLVPGEQSDERAYFARDLDDERDLSKQTVERDYRHDAMNRPSIGTRMFRSLARFVAVVLIGVGLTLAWQSYGEQAKEFARTSAPSLAWLLPAENAKKSPEATASSELMQQMKLIAVDVAIARRNLGQLAAIRGRSTHQRELFLKSLRGDIYDTVLSRISQCALDRPI